jgi:gp16 family phage-associated protein
LDIRNAFSQTPGRTYMLKTRKQVREEFARQGLSYSAWARKHGYSPNLMYEILNDDQTNPRCKCLRGDSHNIAVELGLKAGEVCRTQYRNAA